MGKRIEKYQWQGLSVYYRAGTEDEKVLKHSFDNDIFFKEIPSFKPRKNPVIIDVGAHIGTFSILSSVKFPNSKIFSIEASHETFDILKKNIKTNNLPINAYHNALLDKNETIKLFHSTATGNWGHSVTKELSHSYEEVQAISLDDFLHDNSIEFIDLVKFNCEGSEFNILLNSSQATIKKIGLAIILYHEDLATNNYSLMELLMLFKKESFRTLVIPKSANRGWLVVWNKNIYSSFYFLWSAILRRLRR